MNCNAQCAGCNTFGAGEQYKYSRALEEKYGKGTAEDLHKKSQEYFKVTRPFLEQIIHDSKQAIAFYERMIH